MTKIAETLGSRLEEFHWGMFVVQKFMWSINLAILVGVYGIPVYYLIGIFPVMVVLIWLFGVIINKTGIKKTFVKNYYKDTRLTEKSQ